MAGQQILDGIRAIDFTWVWAGSMMGRHLADYILPISAFLQGV